MRNYLLGLSLAIALGALVLWGIKGEDPGPAACVAITGDCTGSKTTAAPPAPTPIKGEIVNPIGDCTPR